MPGFPGRRIRKTSRHHLPAHGHEPVRPQHNPMVYFDDVTNTNSTGSTYCIANVRPFTELAGDLQSNVVTRYNFITPNLCDDMNGGAGCLAGKL